MAISAVLALGSTPVFAQDAAPSLELPQAVVVTPPVPAASAPTIVLPEAAAPAPSVAQPTIVLPEPVAQAGSAPVAAEPVLTRAERSAAPRTAAAQSDTAARSEPVPAQSVNDASPIAAAPQPAPETAASQPVAAAPIAPTPADADDTSGDGSLGLIAGLLAALGLGAAGFAAMRSRRRSHVAEAEMPVEPMAAAAPVERPMAAARPVVTTPDRTAPSSYALAGGNARWNAGVATVDRAETIEPRPARTSGAALPSEPLTAESRARLIDDMVAAAPDEANPFRSIKARRKRARVLIQHREHQQRQNATDTFDWRTYRPSTKPTPAHPPLVTA